MSLQVNTIYQSIQGEASFTGTPCWFIRLQGCTVGCPWCDTKETWDASGGQRMDIASILDRIDGSKVRHVVITGGEPLEQGAALFELVDALHQADFFVQIETSGTTPEPQWIAGFYDDDVFNWHELSLFWLTVSPKVHMKGGTVQKWAFARADEIKYPVACKRDIEQLAVMLSPFEQAHKKTWLQPVWCEPESKRKQIVELCVEACLLKGWHLSMQMHKFAGIA